MLFEDLLVCGHTVMNVFHLASPLRESESGLASICVGEDDILAKLEDFKVHTVFFLPEFQFLYKEICVHYQN